MLGGRLNREGLWPLQPDTWDDDIFFGLIEVFHDLVSRPRQRDEHWLVWHNNQWIECEEDEEENEDQEKLCHHFTDFSIGVGRALYRWHINTLLKNERIDLRLAESGEDIGRLVRATDDARAELVKRALITPDARVSTRVAHAIALFRSRTASEQNKRSAVIALYGVLEERREVIITKIGSKDEGALFTIANEFAIRHHRRGQQSNYDPFFLDWMFWWCLATIELTDRLLARQ